MLYDFGLADHVGILGVHIKQVRLVGRLLMVTCGFTRDCRDKAVQDRINAGGPQSATPKKARRPTVDLSDCIHLFTANLLSQATDVSVTKASDRAYQAIRAMILSGELSSDDPLGEEALAEKCGVSRTPIRDALRRLEAELLVRRTPSQRSFVADWSLDDVGDAFELRAMLEGYAARRAAERMDEATLQVLTDCNEAVWAAVKGTDPDVDTFLDRNREFHALIHKTASSRRLSSLLGVLIEQPVVWRTAHHYSSEAFKRSHSEHNDLLSAFERRDGPWAEAVMVGHIRRALHAYADAHRDMLAAREAT